MKQLEKFFNNPIVYNLIQRILAFAGSKTVYKKIGELIDAKPEVSVLDVGCGTGKYTEIFKASNYVGVDINDDYLNYARQQYPFGRFINMDSTKLSFADNSFKFVFSVSTFHHLSDDQAGRTAEEMKRVCAAGGTVYIIDNVFPSKINFIGYILFKLDRGRFQRSFSKMDELLSRLGFSVVDRGLKNSFPYRYTVFAYNK
mgnify:CR=1 FL=1